MQAGTLRLPGLARCSNPAKPGTPCMLALRSMPMSMPGMLGGNPRRDRRFDGSIAKPLPSSMPTSMTGTPSMPSIPNIACWGISACPCRHAGSAQTPRIPACPAPRTRSSPIWRRQPLCIPDRGPPHIRHQSVATARYACRARVSKAGGVTLQRPHGGDLIGSSPARPHIPTSTPNMQRCHYEACLRAWPPSSARPQPPNHHQHRHA